MQKGFVPDLAKDLKQAYEDRNKSLMHFNHWLKLRRNKKKLNS